MFKDDDLQSSIEKPITDDFRAQQAEGKRRQRAYEGIDLALLQTVGGCVGTHKLPSIEEVEEFWTEEGSMEAFAFYPHDADGLARELSDLARDAENLRKHMSVDYFPESEGQQ